MCVPLTIVLGPAKMIEAPIFHVNADDPEAVVKVMQMAYDYRKTFKKDVVVDLIGFRRHGHQEVDEPRATQPVMYQHVDKHPGILAHYVARLEKEGIIDQQTVKTMKEDYRDQLDRGVSTIETVSDGLAEQFSMSWKPFVDQPWKTKVNTAVSKDQLISLASSIGIESLPSGFVLHRNIDQLMKSRQQMTKQAKPLDWGYAETLAYASLLMEGYPVRLVGRTLVVVHSIIDMLRYLSKIPESVTPLCNT